jgi:hypothetical protein
VRKTLTFSAMILAFVALLVAQGAPMPPAEENLRSCVQVSNGDGTCTSCCFFCTDEGSNGSICWVSPCT